MPTIINRYIYREIATPFILSITALTFIGLLGKLIKLIELVVNKGLGVFTLFKLIIFIIPFLLVYILPISFLMAVLVAYNRLSGDGEVIAFKASGLSFRQLAMPAMILSIIPFLITLILTMYLFPWGNLNFKGMLYNMATSKANMGLKEKAFIDDFEGLIIYIDELSVTGKEMNGVFIVDEREGDVPNIVAANKGLLLTDSSSKRITIRLLNGTIHSEEGKKRLFRSIRFNKYDINLTPMGTGSSVPSKANRDLFFGELYSKIQRIKKSGGDAAPYIIDLHKRLTLPFAIFVFAIIGIPIGSQWNRGGGFRGFTTALMIVLIYYMLSTFLEFLGEAGNIHPLVAAWGANGAFGAFGLYLFYKSSKEQPAFGFLSIEELSDKVLTQLKRFSKER